MTRRFYCYNIHFCCHLVVAVIMMSWCTGAEVTHVKTTHKPASTTSTFMLKLMTAVSPTTAGIHVPTDYDYLGQTQRIKHEPKGRTAGTLAHVDIMGHAPSPSPSNWATLPAGLDGVLGEQYEWLRERVKILQRHGLKDQVDALQDKYPSVNLTLLYDFYNAGGHVYDADYGDYYYHNRSYHLIPGYMDNGGYWHNETFYPNLVEGQEREDGHYFNGTWYAGEEDLEDGYSYNGTYYGGEVEHPDREDGYYHNDTFYPEKEREDDEDLMWWQLHHPKWKDGGINNVDSTKSLPLIQNQQAQQQSSFTKVNAQPILPSSRKHYQSLTQQPPRRPAFPQAPQKLPTTHHRVPVKRPAPVQLLSQLHPQVAKNGDMSLQHKVVAGKQPLPRKDVVNSGGDISRPGKAAMVGNKPLKEQVNHPGSSNTPATTSWGIVFAVIFGIAVVLAPLACLLYKYRQEKRIKKRTLLRRSEHGSVDEGIMDAMIMTVLGEGTDSRVSHIRKGEGGKLKSYKHRPVGNKSASAHKSQFKSRYELQAPPNKKCFVNIHDEPNDVVT